MKSAKYLQSWRCLGTGLALALAACATLPRSDLQTLEIELVMPGGAAVGAAGCTLHNALGEWAAAAPGKVTVSTDASPLQLRCQAAVGGARGELSARADVRGGPGGRALIGGGAGLVIGGLIGRESDGKNKGAYCCGNTGSAVGAVLGTAIGAGLGAATANPTYAYPARLRVVLQPETPPR